MSSVSRQCPSDVRSLKTLLRPGFVRALALAAATLGLAGATPAMAVERLLLTVGEVISPLARVQGARVSLDLSPNPDIAARIARLDSRRAGLPTLTDVRLACARLDLGPRDFACRGGRIAALAGTAGPLSAALSVRFTPRRHIWRVRAQQVPVAGGRARLAAVLAPSGLTVRGDATGLDLARLQSLVRPWAPLPPGYRLAGHAAVRLALTRDRGLRLQFAAHSTDLNLSNQPGTVVAQQVAASVSGMLVRQGDTLRLATEVRGSSGQALAGTLLLDFGANPLTLAASLQRQGSGPIVVSRLTLEQTHLIRAQASAVVQPAAHPRILSAELHVASLQFPAAYTSYLQLALATTQFGSLRSSGTASGSIAIADDAITRFDGSLHDLNFTDPDARVLMQHASGDIHWAAAPGAALGQSELTWQRAAAYGLSGGPVRLRFLAWHRYFALLGGNTRLPVFDGAVIVHTLVGRDLGTRQATVDFDADVTPISMPRLCKAFGWPVMSGALAGRIPLVRYRDRELTFDGNLVAKVFDGTVTGSHIILRHPLGPFPSLSADVLARGLDLDLVTHTFAFGSMTGRIDADVRGLQLFDWSPVAFDARLYTTPGDRSAHRISQNAVTRIAGLGGGSGAVTAALESGVLRFFHTFHYARVGIGCRLQNEVCDMSGAGAAPDGGYYLVKGSGLPRLDIIGNVRRVDWPRLIGQIEEGMREHGFVVNTGK